jgi:hypothetical protein
MTEYPVLLTLNEGQFEYDLTDHLELNWERLTIFINGAPIGISCVAPQMIASIKRDPEKTDKRGCPFYIACDKLNRKLIVWPTPDREYEMKRHPPSVT